MGGRGRRLFHRRRRHPSGDPLRRDTAGPVHHLRLRAARDPLHDLAGDTPPLTSLLSLLVIVVAIVFVFVRVAPIYPIAVADNRLDFRQAWELTSGRFWRVFAVFGLGMLPLGGVVAAAEGVFLAMIEKS